MIFTALFRWFCARFMLDRIFRWIFSFLSIGNDSEDSYENIISRTCYYAWYVLTRRIDSNYPDVQKKVLGSELVQNAVHLAAQDEYKQINGALPDPKEAEYQELVEKHRQNSHRHLIRLQSCISSSLMRIAGWILYRLLSRIFTSIQFNKSQIDRVRACSTQNRDRNIPTVYLPLHRSHLDYILISFILYMNNIKPPLVAAGDNLNITFFGQLLRGLGAFFIKRRGETTGPQANMYQAIMRSYITENLREGNALEFFMEGGRTRSGKVVMPKFGLLSIVVDALRQGAVDDVYIVPVSISYEKLIEGSFIDEQLGLPKKFENFSDATKAIWETLHSNYGIVRVDFSKPFLLKEYLCQTMDAEASAACQPALPLQYPLAASEQTKADIDTIYNCVACAGTISIDKTSREQVEVAFRHKLHMKETRRQCIESLARHVLFDAYKESALMSTHMVAFLLLTKYRRGVTLDQLANDLDWLRDILHREKGQSLSAFGECEDLVRQAMFYLGKELVATEKVSMKWSSWRSSSTSNSARNSVKPYNRFKSTGNAYPRLGQQRKNNAALWQHAPAEQNTEEDASGDQNSHIEIVYLKPVLKLYGALQLHYYSNSVVSLFHLESVVATALFSFINVDIGSLIYDPTTYISNLTVDKVEFLNRCKCICSMLRYEFYFTKTCQSLDQALEMTFDSYVAKNIFVQSRNNRATFPRCSLASDMGYLSRSSSSSSTISSNGSHSLEVIEESLSEEEYENEHDDSSSLGDSDRASNQSSDPNRTSEFRLLLTSRNCQLLNFYRSILAPYLESYWLTVDRLADFMATTDSESDTEENNTPLIVEEAVFLKDLTTHVHHLLQKGQINYEESISYDTFRNSLKYLDSINAIRRIEQARRQHRHSGQTTSGGEWTGGSAAAAATTTSPAAVVGCPAPPSLAHHSSAPLLTTPSASDQATLTAADASASQRSEASIHSLLSATQMRHLVDSMRIYIGRFDTQTR